MASNSRTMDQASEIISYPEMQNVYNLLQQYAEVNKEVIETNKNGSRTFAEFTRVLNNMMSLMDDLYVEIEPVNLAMLLSIPELNQFNLSLDPLSMNTFMRLGNLLLSKSNLLPQ